MDAGVTDADGNYEFAGLESGTYLLQFGRLPGKTWTDDADDSDASPIDGTTTSFTVDYGDEVTFDVGLIDNTGNHAPQGEDAANSLWEDTSYTLSSFDFGFDDPNDSAANEFAAVIITALPEAGALTLDGVAVAVDQEISVADIDEGLLQFTAPEGESGESFASFSFKVRDDGGTIDGYDTDATANTITFDVESSNDAPEGADNTIILADGDPYVFAAVDFGFSDPDDATPDELAEVVIVSLPTMGELRLDNVAIEAGDSITAAELASGDFTYVPAAGAFGLPLASFEFGIMDDGGEDDGGGSPYSLASYFITFERTDTEDEAPLHTLPAVQTLNEDDDLVFSSANANAISIADTHVGTDDVEVTLTATSGTLTLSGVSGLTFAAGDGTGDEAMTFAGSLADINAALNGLTFTPSADYHGPAALAILTNDLGNGGFGGERSMADLLAITVNSVNDAPEGWDISRPVNEDTVYTFIAPDFGFYDVDGNEFQAVKILSLPEDGTLTNDGVEVEANDVISVEDIIAGYLQFTAEAGVSGSEYASLTFKVQDDGGTANGGADLDATTRTLTFDVYSVNDAPAGEDNAVTTLEDTAYTFAVEDFGFSDPDDNEFLAVMISALPTEGTLTNDGVELLEGDFVSAEDILDDLLVYTPPANANGNALDVWEFQVQDDGWISGGGVDLDPTARTMTMHVTSVNDAPTTGTSTVAMFVNTTYTFQASDFAFDDSLDPSANSPAAIIIGSLPTVGTLLLNGNAVTVNQVISASDIQYLTYTPPEDETGAPLASFTFYVRDDGGTANGGIDTSLTMGTINLWVMEA